MKRSTLSILFFTGLSIVFVTLLVFKRLLFLNESNEPEPSRVEIIEEVHRDTVSAEELLASLDSQEVKDMAVAEPLMPKKELSKTEKLNITIANLQPVISEAGRFDYCSVILYDMDSVGKKTHRYKVIKEEGGNVSDYVTEARAVNNSFYDWHKDHLGMTIATIDSRRTVDATPSPAGYAHYVNNDNYGHWVDGPGGATVWEFYGKYAFLKDALGYSSMSHIQRYRYSDYQSLHKQGHAYYGSPVAGVRKGNLYGTGGKVKISPKTESFTTSARTRNDNFKAQVNQQVKRSSTSGSRTASNSYPSQRSSSSPSYSSSQRSSSSSSYSSGSGQISRTSSRYSSSSSSRSSGGGYGK